MNLVAFAGPARAGKSECADIVSSLCENSHTVVRESFAKPMRVAWARLADILTSKTGQLVNRDTMPDLYRTTMQRWGSSRRSRDPDHWVKRLVMRLMYEKHIEKCRYSVNDDADKWRCSLVLIDDVRFANEVEAIRALGGVVIFVDPKKRIDLTDEYRQHESERLAMDYIDGKGTEMFDDVIVNSGSKTRLLKSLADKHRVWISEGQI